VKTKNVVTKSVLNKIETSRWYFTVKQELTFLWKDANDSEHPQDIRERKLKQYWELYRLYRRQREFYMAIHES